MPRHSHWEARDELEPTGDHGAILGGVSRVGEQTLATDSPVDADELPDPDDDDYRDWDIPRSSTRRDRAVSVRPR